MIGDKQRQFVESGAPPFALCVQAAIVQLAEAHDYACDRQCDPWNFAVEIHSLTAVGVAARDLGGLLRGGYLQHAREVTRPGDATRQFRPARNLHFTRKSCFVLTEAGLRLTAVVSAAPAKAVKAGLRKAA